MEDRDPGGLAVSMLLVLDLGLSSDIVETKVDCKTLFNKYRKSEKGTLLDVMRNATKTAVIQTKIVRYEDLAGTGLKK